MKILNKLLLPKPIWMFFIVPISTALLIYSLTFEESDSVISFISYILSAYALTVLCMRAPKLFERLKKFKQKNKYLNLYFSEPLLRVKLSLYGTVAMNTLYALMQLISGFYFDSVWFYALAGYYILLAVMRFSLLRETVQKKEKICLESICTTVFAEYCFF